MQVFTRKKNEYIILDYGTVANIKETVAFKEATDYLKKEKNISFGKIASRIGLTRSQMDMMRIQRRYITKQELDKFLQNYPETNHFFEQTIPPDKTEEPMVFYNDGHTLKELVDTQRKLIEKLEVENKELKNSFAKLEGENKALKEIISKR